MKTYKNNGKGSDKDKGIPNRKPLKEEYREDLAMYEQSLINYLLQKKEALNNIPGGLSRVRGLSLGINNRNPEAPLFTVQIGMFEVSFNIISGAKDRGTLYGLEKYIMDWYRQVEISQRLEYISKHMNKK